MARIDRRIPLGLVAVPFAWVLALATLYRDYASIPAVEAIVIGVGAAGAGAGKRGAWVVAMGCFLAVAPGRVSLLAVIPVTGAVAFFLSKMNRL